MKKFNFLENLLRKKFVMSVMSGMNGLREDAVNPDSQPTVNRQSRLTSVQRHDSVTSARVAREWLKDKLVNLVKMVMQIFATSATYASANFVSKESNESTVMYRIKSRIPSCLFRHSLDSHHSRSVCSPRTPSLFKAKSQLAFPQFSLASLICLCMLTVGVGQMRGAGTTVTYAQSSSSAASVSSGTAPTGSTVTFSNSYSTKDQVTNGNSMALTLTGYKGYKITAIKLSMHSNAKQGSGTFSAVAGTTTLASISSNTGFNAWYDNTSYGTSYRDVNVTMTNSTYEIKKDEDVVITITCPSGKSNNSLYCQSFTITYEAAGGGCSNAVALSKGTATNGTVNTISSASVATCSATASDRRVTVTITPAACYDAPTNLTWTNTSGTVSASKQSGPTDNGDGTYSYVYQFAQNNNGAGTFGVTCTAKAAGKTVNFNAGPGSCGTSSLTETCDGSGVTLPAVTATGVCKGWTTFAGWATAAVSDSSTTSVTLYAAGAKFVPASNGQTLYAVYSKVKSGGGASWTLSTTAPSVGDSVMVAYYNGSKYLYMKNSGADNAELTVSAGIATPVANGKFKLVSGNSYGVSLENGSNYLHLNSSAINVTTARTNGDINISSGSSANSFIIKRHSGESSYDRVLAWSGTNWTSSSSMNSGCEVYFFKKVTSTTYYCSDPDCCTELGTINGSVSLTTDGCGAGELKATWKMLATTGIASQTLKVYDENADEVTAKRITGITASTSNQTKTISGLDPCKDYMVTIENVSSGGSFCAAQDPWESDVVTTLGYTYTVTANDVTLKDGEDEEERSCDDFIAIYEPDDGYDLPATITVTNAGDEDEGWTWDGETGELIILGDHVTGNVVITIEGVEQSTTYQLWTAWANGNNCDGDICNTWNWAGGSYFSQVGSTNEWRINNFTIPEYEWDDVNSRQMIFNVAGKNATNTKFYDLPIAVSQGTASVKKGALHGAVGTLRIFDNSGDANGYIGFVPNKYIVRFGTHDYVMSETSSTVWETAVQTLVAADLTASSKYRVGVTNSSDGFVAINETCPETAIVGTMGQKSGADTWGSNLASGDAGKTGKFRIWLDNATANWTCHFVPYWHITYSHTSSSGTGSGSMDISTQVSCEGNTAGRTVAVAANGFTAPSGKQFKEWRTNADGTGTKYDPADNVILSSDITLYAIWEDLPTYTITYNVPTCASVSPTSAQQNIIQGNAIGTLPTPTSPLVVNSDSYTFHGWATSETTEETAVAPTVITTSYVPAANTSLYAVYKRTADPVYYTDTLTVEKTAATSTSYVDFKYTSANTSIVYEGQTAKGNDAIQVNNTSPHGIVTTANSNNYVLTSFRIKYNSNTTNNTNRKVKLWAGNHAPANWKAGSYAGIKIGTNVYTSGDFDPTKNLVYTYDFVVDSTFLGIEPQGGAQYWDSIYIKWRQPARNVYITDVDCRVEHTITVSPTPTNGTVTYSGTQKVGETITLTVTPAEGYATTALTATYNDGSTKSLSLSPALTDVAADYTFTMPDYNVTVSATFTARPAAPTISHTTGKYANTQSVTLDCATGGSTIYYTLDGTDPTSSSTTYSSAISVTSTKTIKAIAYKAGIPSTITTSEVTILTGTEYVSKSLSEIWDNDEVVYVATTSASTSFAMSNNNGTSAPSAVAVTDMLTATSSLVLTDQTNIQWNITHNCDGSISFYPNGSTTTWLYTNNNNDGVKVGTGTDKTFEIKDDYLYNQGQKRYIGKYTTDWRSYTTINSNIENETFAYYVKSPTTAYIANPCLATLIDFATTYGTASSAQSFVVKARNISTGNVTVTAPTGYGVCLTENGTYTESLTLTPSEGNVASTTIYVKLSVLSNVNIGTYNGNVTIAATSAGATTRNVALSGTVSCIDAGLEFASDIVEELTGSSVVISDVFSTLSAGGFTYTITPKSGSPADGITFNTSTKTITVTKEGEWDITLNQAASGNYCADEATCNVLVACGTPATVDGLTVSDITYNGATLSWNAVDGADYYELYAFDGTNEVNENVTGTSYTITSFAGNVDCMWSLNVVNSCGSKLATAVDGDEFTTKCKVVYHSATEDDYVIGVTSGGSVAARETDDCDNGKVFVGWTTSAVAALQQSDPTTNTTGAIASVTANTDLYAVFASQNGYTTATILDEKWNVVDWDGTNKIVGGAYSSWATNFADAPSTSFKISSTEYKAIVFDVSSARTITSESAYSNLKEVRITGSNRGSFAMNVTVKVSADKSAWTTVDTKSLGTVSNSSPQTLVFTLDTKGNYYVRIETEAKSSGNKTGITNIRLYQEQDYYLTDYSTNCTKASSPAAITWENGGGSLADGTQPTSATIGSDITMPTLTKADYRFDGWKATINSVAKAEVFTGGDKFTVNHPVTFTAQWTQVFSVTSPTEKLTSYKDVKVTSTTQTFSTVGMHNAVPSVTVTDDTRFTMTINSHEANGGNEDYSYTFSYQPNAFGTGSGAATNTTTATITDARTGVVSSAITLSGRSLPEEFVIAVKKGDQWVALPNNLASTSAQPSIVPQVITVDNTTTPTAAVYAPSTTVYKATGRNNAAKYVRGIRFTTTGSNWLQTAKADGTYNMWLSESNSDSAQVWYLSSSDYGAYTLKMDTKHNGSKKMGIYTGGYMGFHGDPSSSNIYLLPITNKYTEIPATVHEWGVHGVVVQPSTPADLTGVTSASMHIDGASPSDATATAVNVAMGTAKYVRVYAAGATVGAVANEGKQLYVHWKNEGGTEIGVSQVTIPCVVATDATMSSIAGTKKAWAAKSEVHILPGVTLEANASSFSGDGALSVSQMEVYPGATLKVSSGTFNATTLRLRCGWTRAGDKEYDVARVYIADDAALQKTTASMDYDIYEKSDGKHYYPLAVPFRTLVSTINYADAALASAATYGKHFGIDKYDGANRAENGATDENWVQMTTSEYLEPGKGYTITAVSSKGSAIIRVPLTFDNAWTADGEKATIDEEYYKNQVAVTAYTGTASTGGGENNRNAGWNILGVPYMSCFDASDASASPSDAFTKGKLNFITGEYTETNNVYVNVPVHDFSEYIQKPVSEAKLLPGWCFFVQFGKNGTLSFAVDGQEQSSSLPIYAPKRDEMQEVKTGIILSNGDKSDQTTLLISDKYSADEYEINADLEKMFGNGYTLATYSLSRNTRLAYNAMSTTDAKNVIPIGFRAPEDGEYTFSLNPRYAEAAVERVDLIDYQTGEVTNLMMSDYTFKTGRTQDDERFALNVVPMANMPTGVEENSQKSKVESRKLIIDDHVYIIRNGLMYDATGKRVDVINK